jgi:hypothetical protein
MVSQLKVRGAPLGFAPHVFAVQLTNWIEFGVAPDSRLLHAIINNDLGRTVALIGSAPAWLLVHDTLFWLWKFAPPDCYGSRAAVKRWEEMGGRGGLQ